MSHRKRQSPGKLPVLRNKRPINNSEFEVEINKSYKAGIEHGKVLRTEEIRAVLGIEPCRFRAMDLPGDWYR